MPVVLSKAVCSLAAVVCVLLLMCRSGRGGDGEIVEAGRGKWVTNLKYHAGGNQPKKLWLPASEWHCTVMGMTLCANTALAGRGAGAPGQSLRGKLGDWPHSRHSPPSSTDIKPR
jgi:hypothetical protein